MSEELDRLNEKSNTWGGKREGAGRPEGSRNEATLERDRVFNEVKQRILRKAHRIVNSQMSLAEGQQFLYKIEKTKVIGPKGGISYRNEKPVLVTNEWEIQDYLDGVVDEENGEDEPAEAGATYYYITTKEPNNSAIDSMFDRTFDKAKQSVAVSGSLNISNVLDQLENGGPETTEQGVENEPPLQNQEQEATVSEIQQEPSPEPLQPTQMVAEHNPEIPPTGLHN